MTEQRQNLGALIKAQKLRMRQLFLDDAKCELCEKTTWEDGYDGQNEGCEKGLCLECAIDLSLREFAASILCSRPTTAADAPEQQELQPSFDTIDEMERQLKFYKDRINNLQCWQSSMRDPERKIVCDILANGYTLTTKGEIDEAQRHDAAIRKDERERVLLEIALSLSALPDNDSSKALMQEKILKMKESLRCPESHREGEPR